MLLARVSVRARAACVCLNRATAVASGAAQERQPDKMAPTETSPHSSASQSALVGWRRSRCNGTGGGEITSPAVLLLTRRPLQGGGWWPPLERTHYMQRSHSFARAQRQQKNSQRPKRLCNRALLSGLLCVELEMCSRARNGLCMRNCCSARSSSSSPLIAKLLPGGKLTLPLLLILGIRERAEVGRVSLICSYCLCAGGNQGRARH